MPTNPETLERQVAPLRTGDAEVDANVRLWHSMAAAKETQPMTAEAAADFGMEDDLAERKAWRHAAVCMALLLALFGVAVYLLPYIKAAL